MTPPPPKLGQRDLFNDTFFSFLKRKSQPQPAPPPGGPQSPELAQPPDRNNPRTDDLLGEKKAMLQEGHRTLDSTKDLLERNQTFFRKETLKRLRKQAAKLTKGAPAKGKLPKKTIVEVTSFQENAKLLYQEVDNIIREMDHKQAEYSNPQQVDGGRSRSESPEPLPRKPPSPKVTFPADMKPDPHNSTLGRQQSTRRGYDLTDRLVTSPPLEDTMKRRRKEKEADVRRETSQRAHDQNDRREDDRYRSHRDERYRTRHPSEVGAAQDRGLDRNLSYRQEYHSSRSRRYEDRDRDRDRDRYRDDREYRARQDRDRDRHRDKYSDRDKGKDRDVRRERRRDKESGGEKDAAQGEEEGSAEQTPQRVVHPDIPLSATPSGSGFGVQVNPTIVPYPVDEEGRRRNRDRDREREKDRYYRDRDREHRDKDGDRRERDRERERRDRDKDKDKDRNRDGNRELERGDRDRDRERERGERDRYHNRRKEEYYGSQDKHKSRKYDDEYRGSGKSRRDREREVNPEPGESDRRNERRPRLSDSPPSPTDPSRSKFQEVFSPPEQTGGTLPHSEALGWNG